MKVLVIGGGGREHAVCKKLSESPMVDALLCAPGNAGIAQVAVCVPEVKATECPKPSTLSTPTELLMVRLVSRAAV